MGHITRIYRLQFRKKSLTHDRLDILMYENNEKKSMRSNNIEVYNILKKEYKSKYII